MRIQAIAQALGMSKVWLKRELKAQKIEPGRWGLGRRGTQPIEVAEGAVVALVLRFLRSDAGIPFAIKAKLSYNFLRWAVRRDLYVPQAVRRLAELFDPLRWKYDKFGRPEFVVLKQDGSVVRTKLLPSDSVANRPQNGATLEAQQTAGNDGQVRERKQTERRGPSQAPA